MLPAVAGAALVTPVGSIDHVRAIGLAEVVGHGDAHGDRPVVGAITVAVAVFAPTMAGGLVAGATTVHA